MDNLISSLKGKLSWPAASARLMLILYVAQAAIGFLGGFIYTLITLSGT